MQLKASISGAQKESSKIDLVMMAGNNEINMLTMYYTYFTHQLLLMYGIFL